MIASRSEIGELLKEAARAQMKGVARSPSELFSTPGLEPSLIVSRTSSYIDYRVG